MAGRVPRFPSGDPQPASELHVVVFSGGRGSGVLSKQLLQDPRIHVTLAINGYDDGLSTGEVRRFLGDSLGPSDFRKNASRLAEELATCDPGLIRVLDTRLPDGTSQDDAVAQLKAAGEREPKLANRLAAFLRELQSSGRSFDFNDCSIGNLVFAGSFILAGRRFNDAVDDYSRLLGLPPGMIENVTEGTNAYLVALAADGAVLGSEAAIVDATRRHRITDIYLIDHALSEIEQRELSVAGPEAAARTFEQHRVPVVLNNALREKIRRADLIIYAPGTQHSSLFPSYLTPGVTDAIAGNLRAVKLLITNIQADAEIADASAVDIIERAVYYLRDKGRRNVPTPCLITHYIVNDPRQEEPAAPYVPLGQIESLEDPRVVRIANYEEGISGRHDAARILGPFIESLLERRRPARVGVLFHDASSPDTAAVVAAQICRDGRELGVETSVFENEPAARTAVADARVDYLMLFDASGAYAPDDARTVLAHLASGRLDAVWGSRRLWVHDIRRSIQSRYRHNLLLRAASHFGSYALSLTCLALYGRYVSDTLSGIRAVRAADARALSVPLVDDRANQYLLARLLGRKADMLEVPVQFHAAAHVRHVGIADGLRAFGVLVAGDRRLRSAA